MKSVRHLSRFAVACLFLVGFAPLAWAAVDVTASVPSGSYDRQLRVELRATDPAAKIFYTFQPDGSPDDGFMYTGAFVVARSTPVLFFAVVGPQDASLVKREDYAIVYPRTVSITNMSPSVFGDAWHASYAVRNEGSSALDLTGWYFRLASGRVVLHEIPSGTVIPPGDWKGASVRFPADYPRDQLADKEKVELVAPDGTVIASSLETVRWQKIVPTSPAMPSVPASGSPDTPVPATKTPLSRPSRDPVSERTIPSAPDAASALEPSASGGAAGVGTGVGSGADSAGPPISEVLSGASGALPERASGVLVGSGYDKAIEEGVENPDVSERTATGDALASGLLASARDSGGSPPIALLFILVFTAATTLLRAFRHSAARRIDHLHHR